MCACTCVRVYTCVRVLAQYDAFNWATVPITVLVGALLLGIDEIGVQIEEPL